MFEVIFTILLSLLILAFVGFGLLSGKKYRWYYPLTKLVIVLVSALGSFFLSKGIARPIGDFICEKLMSLLPANILEYVNDVPSAPALAGALIAIVLAPIFFIPLFLILRGLMNTIGKIVCTSIAKSQLKSAAVSAESGSVEEQVEITVAENTDGDTVTEVITEVKKTKKTKKARKPKKIRPLREKGANPWGMLCGAICGLLIFITLSIPFSGLFTTVSYAASTLSGILPDNPAITKAVEVTDAAANNPVSSVIAKVYGNTLFEELTSADVNGHKLSLTKEIHLLTAVSNAISSFSDKSVSREEAAQKIRDIGPAFSETSVIPTIVPELFSSAGESWEKGEDFHGIKKIGSEELQPVVDPIINAFATSDFDSVKDDANTVIEILAILTENDVMSAVKSDPKSILENEEATSSVIYNLFENEHFSPVVEGITNFGIQFLGKALHFHAHENELYEEFLSAAEKSIPKALATSADAKAALTVLFDDYGLDVSEESINAIAEKITASNVTEILTTEKITLNNGKQIVLSSPAVLSKNSMLICIDEIELHFSDIEDKAAESKALAKAMHEVMSITSFIGSGKLSSAESIQKLGPILDALSNTKTIGSDSTESIIIGIFQSDLVHTTMGFTLIDATDVAHTICSKSHEHGYAPLLKSVADTIEVVQVVTDPDTKKEEFDEKVGTLIKDLSPESTEVLQKITTPTVIEKKGVSPQSSKHVSALISDVLGNLSNAQTEGMSDEQYQKEAAATSNLLNVALSASMSKESNIFADSASSTEGTGSAISMTASEYVSSVLESEVISSTLVETVYVDGTTPTENPLNLSSSLSEADHNNLMTAIEDHWNAETPAKKADEEVIKKYVAIGYIINIPISVADGELVLPDRV